MLIRQAGHLLLLATLALSQDCGKPVIEPKPNNADGNQRIINGEEAIPHSFPWMVSIQGQADPHYCGASILSPNWVLTAAHCGVLVFVGTYFGDQVVVGQHDRGASQEAGRQVLSIYLKKLFGIFEV